MSSDGQRKKRPSKTQKKLEKTQKVKDLDMRYGIGIFGIKNSSSLGDEAPWKSSWNYTKWYYPSYQNCHRNTVFLLYDDEKTRDTALNIEDNLKIDNIYVDRIPFEISASDNHELIISDLFSEVHAKFSTGGLLNDDKIIIKNISMIAISRLYEQFENTSKAMESQIEPNTDGSYILNYWCSLFINFLE